MSSRRPRHHPSFMIPTQYRLEPDARARALDEALCMHARVAVGGGPLTGKTSLMQAVSDRPVLHTDAWRELPWEEQPAAIIDACAGLERFVLEGVQVARALRKGLTVDVLLWLVTPVARRTPRQEALARGVATVLEGIRGEITFPILVIP